jgi:hemerythrin
MDPNETLKRIRELLTELEDGDEEMSDEMSCLVSDLAEHWDGLDAWLRKGGFLPADWAKGRK